MLLEHPADLGIEAQGPTPGDAFCRAAEGLMSVLVDPSGVRGRERREIHLTGADLPQLLVRWLSEILYLFDGKGFVCGTFGVDEMTPTRLTGWTGGEPLDRRRHRTRRDVKAVTYHQLSVERMPEATRVRVFLDV
ncbi:MAG: archease [Bacteroidota bacterium]